MGILKFNHIMIHRQLFIFLSWMGMIQCYPEFHTIQFIPSATSFSSRVDRFGTSRKIPKFSSDSEVDDFFSSGFPSSTKLDFHQEPLNKGFHRFSSFRVGHRYNMHSRTTPDFSDGLSYPDPFLRTGAEAKRTASYLYSKELFFHNIPHERALLYNQEERERNGLPLHKLGSLRTGSPWYRFKASENFGGHSSFNF